MSELLRKWVYAAAVATCVHSAQADFVRTETVVTTGVTRVSLVDEANTQRVWLVKADMKTSGLHFLHHFSNGTIYNKSIVPDQAAQIAAEGRVTPVAGVNGDFFGYDQGLSQRLDVSDGHMIQTGYDKGIDGWSGSRFYESTDGSFHVGEIRFSGSLTLGSSEYVIQRMNTIPNDGENKTSGVNLFTADYAYVMPGNGLLIEFADAIVTNGNAGATNRAFTIVGTVASGSTVAWANKRQGAIVGLGSTDSAAILAATGSGTATWGFVDSENANTPVDVRNLVGVWLTILKNGEIVPSSDQNETSAKGYPRTCLGYNPTTDLLVLLVADGRQADWSYHTTSAQIADILRNEGCTYGAQFDGGGSTTMWNCDTGLVNRPSNDGHACRPVATALFLTMDPPSAPSSPVGEALPYLYPTNTLDNTTFGDADTDLTVNLPSTVSVSGAYVRCIFNGMASKPCRLQGIRGRNGSTKLEGSWDAVYTNSVATPYDRCFYVYPGATQIDLRFQSAISVTDYKAELISEAEAKAWSDDVWSDVNANAATNDILSVVLDDYPLPVNPFAKLPKFKAALTNGTPFSIHFLGDSIAQDTYFSMLSAQLRVKYPHSNLRFTLYQEGSKGCWYYYQDFAKIVGNFNPDLLVICGLDHFRSGTDEGYVTGLTSVIQNAKAAGIEILYMTPAHSVDSRLMTSTNPLWVTDTQGFNATPYWNQPCEAASFVLPDASADYDYWTRECYKPSLRNPVLEAEDIPMWDIYPQSYDFVSRSGRPWGWFNRDQMHNNERGRALIAHLLMAYVDKGAAYVDEPSGPVIPEGRSDVLYVGPEGTGTGTSWGDLAPISAINSADGTKEVWLKAGDYTLDAALSSSVALTIRGGFAGTESDATDRVAGAKSVLDGGKASDHTTVLSFSAASGTIVLDGLVLSNAYSRAVYKSGKASAVAVDCVFTRCGLRTDAITGRGGYWSGGTSSTLAFSNCVFRSNYNLANNHNSDTRGAAAYITNFKKVTMDGCTIEDCGLAWSVHNGASVMPGRDGTEGYVLYCLNAPLEMTRTRVAGNTAGYNNTHGGAIFINSGCGGSRFANCAFVGNHGAYFNDGGQGGVLRFCDGCSASVESCTFAYNVFPKAFGAAIVLDRSGTVTISNSIFWNNVTTQRGSTSVGSDIYLAYNTGTVTLSHSLVGGTEAPYLYYPSGGGVRITTSNLLTATDPLFATLSAAFTASLTGSLNTPPYNATDVWFKSQADALGFDVHLQSYEGRYENGAWQTDTLNSQAIDMGNPSSAYALEPAPNGGRLNLGAYGNTPEASKTKLIVAAFAGEVTVDAAHDYTRPHFSVSLAENAEAYVATVEIAYSTSQPSDFGAETLAADWRDNWGAVDIASSAAGPGDSVEAHTKGYYATGTTIWWRLAVTTSGGTIWREGSVLLSGSTPPAWGRGGDASVIHVWTEASGIGDGSTWLDGCNDLESAFALVTETRTNIWIAGTVPAAKGVNNPQMLRGVTIIGGFTGMENAVADRPLPIARAVISGHNQQYKGCLFSVPEGAWTTLCDIDVTGAFDHGIQKTGNGSLALYNVDVHDNACNSLLFNGRGLHLVGNSSKSELVLSNVVIKSNYILGNGDAGNDMYTGSGLYLTDFKLATMTDVSFVHNGIILSKHDYCPGRDSTDGGSIYVKNVRVAAKNVAFVGNNSGCNSGRGCVMYLTGNCNGSVFENCRWVGNEHCHYSNGTALLAGALTIGQDQASRTVELRNCTFAFNTGDWATCAGLHVNQGTVKVRNSIFAKNVVAKNVGLAADLRVTGGTLDIDYSLLTANTADYITQDSSKITMGEHMLWGDPAFATDDATFLSYIQNGAIPKATADAVYFKNSDGADMRALDVHLRSKAGRWTGTAWTNDAVSSVCIDAAVPDASYDLESVPNGGRANIGCYANTTEASLTALGDGIVAVAPDGDPEANGAVWGFATTLAHALDLVVAAGGGEIWMKGGTYPVSSAMSKTLGSCAMSIRGGFAGSECSPDERVPGTARAKLDAQGGNLSSILSLTTSAGLTLENVSFLNAQPASGTGTAVTLTGGSGCDLVVSNCTFEGNLLQSNPGALGLMRGLKINTFRSAVIDDSLFVSNGYAQAITSANNHYGKDSGTKGAGLWIAGTPFTMRRCRIAANKFTCHCDNASAFWVSGNCNGSLVKNCAFVGNLGVRSDANDGKGYKYESAAVVDMDTLARTIVFDNCTFAYNSQIEQSSPAGLSINKATVTVKNSIFYANTQCGTGSSKVAADIYSSTAGISVSIDYCWFAGSDTKFVFAGAIMGSHNTFASEKYPTPSFASALTDYADAVNFSVSAVPWSTATAPNFKSLANAAALDVHLRSKAGRWSGSEWINDTEVSVCIDKGDPATSYEDEPEVNGGQVNLGAYGGTAEASKSIVAEAAMTVTDTTGNDYTQPNAAVTCPDDPNDGIYHLQIWFCYGETAGATNDLSSWSQKVLVTSDAQPGSSFVARPMRYFESGTTLKWCVIMTDAEGNAKLGSTVYTSELTGETPPWYGKGGGATVLHVRPGATGKGDGSTWTDAVTDWATAFGMFTNGSPYAEMWLSGTIETTTGMTVDGAPVTRTYTQPLAIRGGYTGSENAAADRSADGTIGTIDGLGTAGALFLVQSDYTVELDRIAFNGCARQAVVKTGAGDLIVKGCRFYRNVGPFEQYGRALTVTGSSGSTVVAITNSIFGGNYYTGTIGCARGADGGGLWAKDLKVLTVDSTLFASNGLARSSRGNYASQSRGYAVYIENAPTVMTGVDFVQNVGSAHITDNSSGESAVLLTGSSSGSRFENCSWVGNMTMDSDTLGGKGRSNHAGAMSVYLSTKNDTVAFTNCTFAYNFILDYASPGGLNITRGRASIGNSIFYGNATCKNGSSQQVAPADLAVSSADGYAAVDYTFFVDGTDAKYVTQTAGRIAIGEHCLSGSDPAFATDVADVMALIQPSDISAPPCIVGTTSRVSFKDAVDAQAFDVHLKSSLGRYRDGAWLTTDTVDSPCLDKGDATWEVDSDTAREPKPNAGRVNLGRYGNTSEASKSEPNNPALGDVTLDLECDYTMPHVSVELAGTGTYGAKVWFCYGDAASAGEGTNGWAHVVLAGSGFRGDTIDASPRRYFEPNATFTWCVVMMSADGTIVYGASEPVTSTVGADVAPWYGKGGGAGVLHVRAGATGLGTGENWSDALSSLDEAFALIDDSHNEIWFSGDHATSASPVAALTFAVPVTLRGGFAATENSASERVTGAKSNFDGAGRSRVFWIGGTNAFTVDGFNFKNGTYSLFEKDGAGDLTILNCRFADLSTTEDYITAVRLCGTGASRLAIDGVTVENIRRTCGANTGAARGMVVTTFASATIKDSLFARCGYARSVTVGAYSHSGNQSGSALCVIDTPVTITGSTFYGNSYPGHVTNSGSYDGNRLCAVLIAGACGNSVMRNCFVGANSGLNADSADGKGAAVYSGTMVVSISSGSTFLAENCTFAYNQSIESHSPLALNLYEGVSTVRNCIFYGNVKPGGVGADIGGKSSSTVEYSFFKDTTSAFVSGVTLGAGNVTGEEPYFVTTLDDYKATLGTTCSTLPTVVAGGYFKAAIDTEPMFNVHLRGNNGYLCETNGVVTVMPMPPESGLKQSPCIDAGDPATSVKGKEANPNGGRVNLGRWGNTAWASRSASTGLIIMLF